ncbi:MAG: TetR family transcriptional regulator [Streptosporangiales bacterium]|nr:TetR family transcriptional regulator [Streptosporangiales bacterium]
MGNREDLLGGAVRCLREKGYAQITARDIASAAGTSLAAIGYHFGSKEALLNAALFEVMDSWGAEFATAMPDDDVSDPIERFATAWTGLLEVATRQPELAAASFESFLQARRSPELRAQLAAGQEEGRRGLVAVIQGIDEADVTDEQSRTLGSFYSALLSGVLGQWLIDPDRAPSGRDLAEALRAVTGGGG